MLKIPVGVVVTVVFAVVVVVVVVRRLFVVPVTFVLSFVFLEVGRIGALGFVVVVVFFFVVHFLRQAILTFHGFDGRF